MFVTFSKPTCSPDKIRSSSSVLFVLAATFEIRTMILRSNYLMMRIQCLCVMYCIVMYWRCSCWFLTPWVFSLLSRPSIDSSRQEHFCCICRNICQTSFFVMITWYKNFYHHISLRYSFQIKMIIIDIFLPASEAVTPHLRSQVWLPCSALRQYLRSSWSWLS